MTPSLPIRIPIAALVAAALAVAALLLTLPQAAFAAVSVTRAELKSGQLRVEGRGAAPNVTITVSSDSVATGRADSSGAFRVETSGFVSSTCHATVSDGATSTDVTLAECTPAAPAPSPTREPTPTPTPEPTPTPTPEPTSEFTIVDETLPDGNVGTSYTAFLFAAHPQGDEPVEYRIVSGRLPAGLTLVRSFGVASAAITGTPTTVGVSTFTVQARDGAGQTASRTLSITIHPPAPLAITNISDDLAPGIVGAGYQIKLFAGGGVKPYRWSLAGGQLPPGLSLARDGLISGTPTTAGSFGFTARVTDQSGAQTTRQFSITVSR